jgi:hypothetical protein
MRTRGTCTAFHNDKESGDNVFHGCRRPICLSFSLVWISLGVVAHSVSGKILTDGRQEQLKYSHHWAIACGLSWSAPTPIH